MAKLKPVFYIDMDGVLAVWNKNASEEDTHQHGYFISRDIELSAVALVRCIADKGYKVKILSAVYEDDHSAKEKRQWLDRAGLSDIEHIFVPYGQDKYKYVTEDGELPVLLDDYSKNLRAWGQHGYLAFKFFNGVNNQPRFEIGPDSTIKVTGDTWDGYSIDHRMSPRQMETVLVSVAEAEAERRAA